eukprot:scaffold990_cov108-Cylindrotheca_fusiformis.AAC.1
MDSDVQVILLPTRPAVLSYCYGRSQTTDYYREDNRGVVIIDIVDNRTDGGRLRFADVCLVLKSCPPDIRTEPHENQHVIDP